MQYCAPYRWGKRRDAVDRLTIIAKLKAKDGAEDQLFEECRKLVGPTRAEEGCINYDMHRSVEDPGLIMFHENWTSRPLWERHMESPAPAGVLGQHRRHRRGVGAVPGREGGGRLSFRRAPLRPE
jgi:quinol monooxygenase YgiN